MQLVAADHVVTVDAHDTVLADAAVLLGDDGTIVAVGPTAELVAAHPTAEAVQLPGHVLLPGLVNAHTHLAMTMFRGLADDRDLQGFLDRVVPAEAAVLDAERVRTATVAAAVESVSGGVTTALDMYFFPDAVLDAAHEVGLRVVTGPTFFPGEGPERLGGAARLAWAERWLGEHPARPGWRPVVGPHSTYLVPPDELVVLGELAARHDAVLHVHAAESPGEVTTVLGLHGARPVELLDQLGLLRPRTVLAHGVHLDDAELAAVAESGAAVAHCPASNLKLGSGIARVPELVVAGAVVGLGTDGAASSNDLDLFAAMRLAALVHKGVSGDATVLPAARVLRSATMGGADALGLGGDLGSLEVGKRGDVVAVDLRGVHTRPVHDPVAALVYAAGRADVRHVWVEGRPVLRDGVTIRIDALRAADELERLGEVVRSTLG
jgi:5-methylthioadenosine/S-adenosylhomocysteine deaminase